MTIFIVSLATFDNFIVHLSNFENFIVRLANFDNFLWVWPILTILLFVWPSLTILLCVRPILPSGVGLSFRFSPESWVEISILGTKLCWILVETALVKDLSGNSSCCERCEASLLCPL